MIQESALRGILDTIEGTNYASVQSMEQLKEYGFQLQQWMAFASTQMVECKKALHDARRKAMVNLVASLKANGATLTPQLQKDYVGDLCGAENALYLLAERCNKTCTHAQSLVITCISALKEEMAMNR